MSAALSGAIPYASNILMVTLEAKARDLLSAIQIAVCIADKRRGLLSLKLKYAFHSLGHACCFLGLDSIPFHYESSDISYRWW